MTKELLATSTTHGYILVNGESQASGLSSMNSRLGRHRK